jgi:hypothetical protein
MDPYCAALLREIEAFLVESGMSATAFGDRAVNDGRLVSRLRISGNVTSRTTHRIRQFIAAQRTGKEVA